MLRQARQVLVILVLASLLPLSACTTDITDTISSTTPGFWYTQDGLLQEQLKTEAFVTFNFENLRQDMATGRGEYLTSLGTLLRVPDGRRAEFYALTQARYQTLFPTDGSTPSTMLASLQGAMIAHRF